MKLIKQGKNPDDAIWRATCHHCGSVWEAKKKELKFVWSKGEKVLQTENCEFCGKYGLRFKKVEE